MSKENIVNCLTHPFRADITSADAPLINQNESNMPRHDVLFPMDRAILVRSFDGIRLNDVLTDSYPNGGFRLREWLEKEEDGHETVRHYHVEILPKLNPDTSTYLNGKIKSSSIDEGRRKADILRQTMPSINVCPTMGISFAAGDEHYFSITPEGDVVVNPETEDRFEVHGVSDGSYRFVTLLDFEDDDPDGLQIYKMYAFGMVATTDFEDLIDKLDIQVGLGTLRPNDTITKNLLDSIASMEVNIVQ